MPDLIVLCALDAFGAEALAKVRLLDPAVATDERILWNWAGEGEHPQPAAWTAHTPFWSGGENVTRLALNHAEEVTEQFDRGAYLSTIKAVAAKLLSEWNRHLDLQERRPDERLVHLIFAGSLADPRSALRALAFFQAYSLNSALWGGWRLSGAWALGRNTSGLSFAESLADAITAVSLKDLATAINAFGTDHKTDWVPLLPQYLAGNGARLADPLPSRLDAALLCAMGVLGVIHAARGRLRPESLFLTQHESDQLAYWASHTIFSPERPFAALGSAVIVKRQTLLLEAFATFTVGAQIEQLQQQDPPEPGWGPLPANAPHLVEALKRWQQAALVAITERLAEYGFQQESDSDYAFGSESVKATIGWDAFHRRFQDRIERAYGWNSFASLPLESWEQSLQELKAMSDRFFLADRQRYLGQFAGAFVQSLDHAVRSRLDSISLGAYSSDAACPFAPHLAGRRFVADLEAKLEQQKQDDELSRRKELNDLCPDDELPKIERNTRDLFAQMRRAIRKVPSPLAILARIITIFVVALFCFGIVEIPYYANRPPEQVRILKLIPAAIFTVAFAIYLIIKCRGLKRQLRATFERWFREQLSYYRERNLRLVLDTRQEMYQLAVDYFRWLALMPDKKTLPTFVEFSHRARERSSDWPMAQGPLAEHEIHRFLHTYPADLANAAQSWCEQLLRIIARFTECSREFILPYIPRGKEGVAKLQRLVKEVLPGLAGRPEEVRYALSDIIERIQRSDFPDPERPALLYQQASRRRRNAGAEWSGAFAFLPLPALRANDEGARNIMETLVAHFRQTVGGLDRSLTQWLLNDLYEQQRWEDVRDLHPPTWHLIDRAKLPPLAALRDQQTPLMEIWMPAENTFTRSFDPQDRAPRYVMHDDSHPHRAFYALVSLHHSLNAEEVLFGPGGNDDPDNLLGKHWAAHAKAAAVPKILEAGFKS